MIDQLSKLAQKFGNESVVNNTIPNEHKEGIINEASNSIFSGLQKAASEGKIEQLAQLFQGNSSINNSNPVVQKLTQRLSGNLGEKFGLSDATSANVAESMIPQVLNSLVDKAKDPSDNSFKISDIINSISDNTVQASGIMDAISKYDSQFGSDQNADGKVNLNDTMSTTKSSGLLGKLFRK
jgi:hypothetical protein